MRCMLTIHGVSVATILRDFCGGPDTASVEQHSLPRVAAMAGTGWAWRRLSTVRGLVWWLKLFDGGNNAALGIKNDRMHSQSSGSAADARQRACLNLHPIH
mmetsp:Transcript_2933/g.6497  ORF Transcript_2933/g.6497 Transcript_2933/m.6497 type:complete len:101 (-) Transcript_2933:9-311(-)